MKGFIMVPTAAEILLNFIGETETGRTGIDAYRTIYRHKQGTLPKPVTDFTLDELLATQLKWGKNWGSSAAGKYQIIRKTLVGLVVELGLPGSTKFTPAVQDQMGFALLKRRGWNKFAAGQLSLKDYGNELAKEWASLPVLNDMQGASRNVTRGQSYYAGDGLNKSLTKPGDVEAVLSDVLNRLSVSNSPAQPVPPRPTPSDTPKPTTPVSKPYTWQREGLGWTAGILVFLGLVWTFASEQIAAFGGWLVSLFT